MGSGREEEGSSLSGCIAELKRMAAARGKVGEPYLQKEGLNRSRRMGRTEAPEVGDIIDNLKRYRRGAKHEESRRFAVREANGRKTETPTNAARPMSNGRNRSHRGERLKSTHNSFVESTRRGGESRRYRSTLRGQETAYNDKELFRAQLCSSQAYGSALGTEFNPTQELYFNSSKKNSSAKLDMERTNAAHQRKPQEQRATRLPNWAQEEPGRRGSDSLHLNVRPEARSKCSKSCSRGPKVSAGSQRVVLERDSTLGHPKDKLLACNKRLVTTYNDYTYGNNGKDTTKSSDRTSMMHTKGSIKAGKSELNMSCTQCPDGNDSLSVNGMSVLNQINNAMGKQENMSVEDMHCYFVAFYQRTKKMLSELEMEHDVAEPTDETPQPPKMPGEDSVVSVQQSERSEEVEDFDSPD